MARAKAGSGSALIQRELPAQRERPPKPVLAVMVKEMVPSARQQTRSVNWRGRPTVAELAMRSERSRASIRKRRGIKIRVRLSPERKILRAQRKMKRKTKEGRP